jgi:type VI secretion system protein ImpM
MTTATIPGWYGKLPTLGDFASRRLDADWIAAWDGWLAQGLSLLRERFGDAWLDGYLDSPPWRFVLMPGVLDGVAGAWAGVLLASVDRVGRYFPFTIAAPLEAIPRSAAALDALLEWLQGVEAVAADAMHDDWDIERVDTELTRLGLCATAADDAMEPTQSEAASRSEGVTELLRRMLEHGQGGTAAAPPARAALIRILCDGVIRRGQSGLEGTSFWLAAVTPSPRLAMHRGLPEGDAFAALFGVN